MNLLTAKELELVLERLVIGLEEPVLIKGLGSIKAKVDSGNGGFNVIHGDNFVQEGDMLSFDTFDSEGQKKRVQYKIDSYVDVNIGSGNIQHRPVVLLNIKFANEEYKEIPFSVTDRSDNINPILISKSFVQNELDALIDVGAKNISNDNIQVNVVSEGVVGDVAKGVSNVASGAVDTLKAFGSGQGFGALGRAVGSAASKLVALGITGAVAAGATALVASNPYLLGAVGLGAAAYGASKLTGGVKEKDYTKIKNLDTKVVLSTIQTNREQKEQYEEVTSSLINIEQNVKTDKYKNAPIAVKDFINKTEDKNVKTAFSKDKEFRRMLKGEFIRTRLFNFTGNEFISNKNQKTTFRELVSQNEEIKEFLLRLEEASKETPVMSGEKGDQPTEEEINAFFSDAQVQQKLKEASEKNEKLNEFLQNISARKQFEVYALTPASIIDIDKIAKTSLDLMETACIDCSNGFNTNYFKALTEDICEEYKKALEEKEVSGCCLMTVCFTGDSGERKIYIMRESLKSFYTESDRKDKQLKSILDTSFLNDIL